MGTRHLTMVVSDGKTRISQYGQWDGMPKGQGYTVLDFLRKQKGNFDKFKKKLENCRFCDADDDVKIKKFMESIGSTDGWMTMDQSAKYHKAYPYMTRDHGAKILDMVLKSKGEVLLSDATNFSADSLFCEWAYVIDFDKNVLECYGGFNDKEPVGDDNRFKQFEDDRENKEYYCITLLKTYELDKLPNKRQFVNDLEPKEVEEEV